ncbi:MAG: NAD-dependent epimerase/dehydratase family protein [Candidatus Nanoarchaeia archaeon]|nr:NAD-dependent epimerase/dehydratase family protein [Candidatus Nanoarchaeia archaeon]
MKKRILITGGTGFVGRKLVEEIKNTYDVKVLSQKSTEKNIIPGNLLIKESLENSFKRIDTVVHLAASKNNPENIPMAENLVEICRKNKIKKIIYMSSMAAKRSFPDEYGKTKQKIEKIIIDSGLKYTILRPSIIYGPGSTSFNFILEKIRKLPFVPIVGNGRYLIFPVHIDDIIKAVGNCINNPKTNNKEYDIPGGDGVYFIEMINELKRQIGIRKPNLSIPVSLCRLISIIAPNIISPENIKNLTEDSLADLENTKRDLKINIRGFREGVKNGII